MEEVQPTELERTPSASVAGHRRDSPAANRSVTWEGCSVLLDINDGDRLVFARLSPSATIQIGNKKCRLNDVVGCPFGSLFKVETGPAGPHLEKCSPSFQEKTVEQSGDDGQLSGEIRDNRSLFDNNTAQSLSSDDIEAMRREGATGDEIIKALIANSSTFEKKTVYSQEKYKLKKQKKYAPKVLLRRPSMRSICETYFKKHPTRTGFMRVDALSLLLSLANIGAYSDALIFDKVGGLVVGSVAERIGGTGHVCSTYFGSVSHPMDIVRMFNFSNEICSRIFQAPFSDFSLNPSTQLPVSDTINNTEFGNVNTELSSELLTHEETPPSLECAENNNDKSFLTCQKRVKAGRRPSEEIIKLWKENGFTSLIIVAPEMEVESLVLDLLPLLSYSAPFAIYHQFLQPLASCMHKLQTSKMAIGLQISEPWLREYQVLPSRTHPHMQMNAFGGYILSGIKICNKTVN